MTRTRNILAIFVIVAVSLVSHAALAAIDPNLSISPNPLVFDDVAPGGTSGPETIRVTNTSTSGDNIFISNVGLSDDVNFHVTSNACSNRTLTPNTYCDASVTFTPTSGTGGYFGSFVVLGSSDPIGVSALQGQAVAPMVTLTPTSVNFGNQSVGTPSSANDVMMKNSGNAALSITSITTAAPFSVTDDCGATLGAGSTCTISQTFTPTAEGAAAVNVSIVTNAQTSPNTIPLSGTGVAAGQPDASFSTSAIDFGGQVVNTTSSAQTVNMKNTGTVNLTVGPITPPAGFATSDNCGAMLAPAAECAIDVTFSPTATEAYSGNLAVATNAADSPHNIALTGFGSLANGPSASFSQTSMDFGEQRLRTASSPQTDTITSVGSEGLVISSIEKTADNSGSYSGDDNCIGRTIAPGDTCAINVTFNPQEKGTLAATASVTDNSQASPHTLIATGIGVRVSGGSCSLTNVSIHASSLPLYLLFSSMAALALRRKML